MMWQPSFPPAVWRRSSAPVRTGRYWDVTVNEHKPFASVLVDADRFRGAFKSGVSERVQERVNRTRVGS